MLVLLNKETIHKVPRMIEVEDGLDLLWVRLNSFLSDHITQEFPSSHSERALHRIQLHVVLS